MRLAGQTAVAVAALSRRVTVRDAGRGGFETSQRSKFRANPPKVSITVSSPSELQSFLIKWWSMHECTVSKGPNREWSGQSQGWGAKWGWKAGRRTLTWRRTHNDFSLSIIIASAVMQGWINGSPFMKSQTQCVPLKRHCAMMHLVEAPRRFAAHARLYHLDTRNIRSRRLTGRRQNLVADLPLLALRRFHVLCAL